jgi:phospholipase C
MNIIISKGTHKERGTSGQLVKLYWLSAEDNKYHLSGYEIQEYSNDKDIYMALGYFIKLSSAMLSFEKYFNVEKG